MNEPFGTNPRDYLIVTGIEDRSPYMLWQLELLVNSFAQWGRKPSEQVDCCKVNPKDICAVVHTKDGTLSKYFLDIVETYGIKYVQTRPYGRENILPYFKAGGVEHFSYLPFNKACCFGSVYSEGLHQDYKFTMLTDSDVFAYKFLNVQKFPTRVTSIAEHWLCDHPVIDYYPNDQFCEKGIDLLKLMDALHVPKKHIENYRSGGCITWLKREDMTEGVVNAIPGYVELLRGVCSIIEQPNNWCCEMPVYALALASNGIKAELVHEPEFSDSNCAGAIDQGRTPVLPGAMPHYGYKTAWEGTTWNKWDYADDLPMNYPDRLEECLDKAAHGVARSFFESMLELNKTPLDRSMDRVKVKTDKSIFDLNDISHVGNRPVQDSEEKWEPRNWSDVLKWLDAFCPVKLGESHQNFILGVYPEATWEQFVEGKLVLHSLGFGGYFNGDVVDHVLKLPVPPLAIWIDSQVDSGAYAVEYFSDDYENWWVQESELMRYHMLVSRNILAELET